MRPIPHAERRTPTHKPPVFTPFQAGNAISAARAGRLSVWVSGLWLSGSAGTYSDRMPPVRSNAAYRGWFGQSHWRKGKFRRRTPKGSILRKGGTRWPNPRRRGSLCSGSRVKSRHTANVGIAILWCVKELRKTWFKQMRQRNFKSENRIRMLTLMVALWIPQFAAGNARRTPARIPQSAATGRASQNPG